MWELARYTRIGRVEYTVEKVRYILRLITNAVLLPTEKWTYLIFFLGFRDI